MRRMKRWLTVMLTVSMALGDCGGMTSLAREEIPADEEISVAAVSENSADMGIGWEETEAGDQEETETEPDAEAAAGTEMELPALHMGQMGEGDEYPDLGDAAWEYDLPVLLETEDSVVLYVNYGLEGILEDKEAGTLVWSILRGRDGMEEGSTNLLGTKDDWIGFETVSDAPYFTMSDEDAGDKGTVRIVAREDAGTESNAYDKNDTYYIRAAYYAGTEEEENAFYAAVTVPFLPGENTGSIQTDTDMPQDETTDSEVPDAENMPADTLDMEQQEEDRLQDDLSEPEVPDADSMQENATGTEIQDETEADVDAADLAFAKGMEEENSEVAESDETLQEMEESVVSLTLSPDSIPDEMNPGDTFKLTATVEPASMQAKIVWKSSDKGVATVNADGEITAQAEGKAQITAQCGDKSVSVKVEVVRADTVKLVDISGDIWVAGFVQESDDLVYTGQKITQDIRIYYKDTLLQEKTDYTLVYKNNINAAAYNAAKAPSITVNLKGQYSGSRTLYFTIKPMDLIGIDSSVNGQGTSADQKLSPGYEQTVVYSKTLKIPNPELKFGKIKLKVNKDFVCDYTPYEPESPGAADQPLPMPENYKDGDSYAPGAVYEYTVNGTGNFTGSLKMQLVVVSNKDLNFSSAVVTLDQKQYEYHGTPLSAADVQIKSVKVNGKTVEESLYGYEVCMEENAGAYVIVSPSEAGTVAGYRGSKKVSLKLSGDRSLKGAVQGEQWQESLIFSQKTLEEEGGFFQEKTGLLTFGTGEEQETLTEGKDYTVKYSNAKKVGKVTVTFTGTGRYKDSVKKQYQIVPDDKEDSYRLLWGENVKRVGDTLTVPYLKGGASPEFTLKDKDNYVLKNKTDYTVKLKNNTAPGQIMSCEIIGKGNYKGYQKSVELQVVAGDISKAQLSAPDKAYSTKANAWKSKVTIKDTNGKALTAGKDYGTEIDYYYEGMENGEPPASGSTVTVTVYGENCYAGSEITGSYRIYQNNISKLKIAIDAQEYTGEEVALVPYWEESWENGWKHDIHVYANATDLKKQQNEITEVCYEIVGYQNNVKAGTARVTLRGMGAYGGTKTYSFKIQKRKYQINHVKKLTLDQTNLSVRLADKKATLTATLVPEEEGMEITNPTILWASSNSGIASVAADTVDGPVATVSFHKEGTVTITATAQDGSRKAQCKLTIVNVPLFLEAGQTLEGKVGETCQLHVEWEEPEAADTSKLRWESNNPERVSVSTDGLVTMKKVGAAVITLRVTGSNYIQQCNVVVKGEAEEELPEGNYITYEQKPGTVDDAIAINQLLWDWEHNPGRCDYLYLPAGVYHIGAAGTQENGIGGIILRDNQKLVMSPSALLVAIGNNSDRYHIIYAFGRDNVTISGGQIIGERDSHTGKGGEDGHGIRIEGCTNVHISDVEISRCWGDGIYLGAYSTPEKPSCDGVTIENCNLHHNRRNNLSITDANNVTIDCCQFNYANGTDPQYGIDIEHNYRTTEHVKISNSTFKGNAKASMGIIKAANDIRIENCTMDGDFYNMAGKNVVLKDTKIAGEIVGSVKRE